MNPDLYSRSCHFPGDFLYYTNQGLVIIFIGYSFSAKSVPIIDTVLFKATQKVYKFIIIIALVASDRLWGVTYG